MKDSNGLKFSISTGTFNGLVTSSVRIDTKSEPELGSTTHNSILKDRTMTARVKITLDKTSFDEAVCLAGNPNATEIQKRDILFQLKQARSKFDCRNTYKPSRANSSMASFHRL